MDLLKLKQVKRGRQESRGIIGYTAGCFDMFHVGHLNILRRAREQCDYLIVGVNSDDLMKSYKGKKPIISHADRMEIVESVRYVDSVVSVEVLSKLAAYKQHNYDIIFVGDDHKGEERWSELEEQLRLFNSKVVYLPYTDKVSSTQLRAAIIK